MWREAVSGHAGSMSTGTMPPYNAQPPTAESQNPVAQPPVAQPTESLFTTDQRIMDPMQPETVGEASWSPAPVVPRRREHYGSLWRAVPGELLFLLLTMPIAIVGMSVVSSVFFTGVGLAVLGIGIVVIIGSLWVSRFFAETERVRLRTTGLPAIAAPMWEKPSAQPEGALMRLLRPLANARWWLALVHTFIVNPVVSITTWTLTIAWASVTLSGLTYWFWSVWIPEGDTPWRLHEVIWRWAMPGTPLPADPALAQNLFYVVLGLVFLATLPFVTRGLSLVHWSIARGMLGAWRSESLRAELVEVEASRTAALAAEDTSIRRLERDIHDGPQQRLIRLQMDIAAAERRIDTDPEAARTLLTEAGTHARDALDELRALSKGLAPPLLQDRGLVPALESLAARNTVPTSSHLESLAALQLPSEIERSTYFVVAELLTNVAKHSGANRAFVAVSPAVGGRNGEPVIVVTVSDDGRGGAAPVLGHGLAGLDERVRGLAGTLTVDSPVGGPTTVAVTIPVPAP